MRYSILFLGFFTCLGACASPSPRFLGADRHDVVVEGSRFAVFHRADEVEVYRLSKEFLPRESAILLRAVQAIEMSTGCSVRPRSMSGDQALITAEVDCV